MECNRTMVSALDGITVLDLTQGPAGAIATMFLCDNGARVVHIEAPGSESLRADDTYKIWDRGKESVVLDIAAERQNFDRLVSIADVLVESYAPSSEYQSVVGYEMLASINPRLVYCSITAYGKEGPLKDEPAQHDLVMARVGILSNQPSFRDGPVHVVHPVPSVGAGIMAAQGIVASLYSREKTGRGRKVETSLMAGALMYVPKIGGDAFNSQPSSFRGTPSGGAPFYSLMECADGEWIHLGCIHLGFVKLAAEAMGVSDIVADPKYSDRRSPQSEELRQELYDIVANIIKTKTYRHWAEIFEEADVPYARVSTAEEGMENPQILHNEMVIELDDPEVGKVTQMGLPIKFSRTPGNIKGPRALFGHHTDAVLSEIEALASAKPKSIASDILDPPLKGVKILEMTNAIAGPSAGKMLSDLGAETIKLESPAGDIFRPSNLTGFHYLNSNKRSISLNAATPEGKEVAQKLAAKANVLLANMRSGVTDRLGLGSDELKKINPNLIEMHVTAFGWDGPDAHRAGVDPIGQALTGLERAQGGPELQPIFLGMLAPIDFTTGALAALGAIIALFARERTGVAQKADTNLLNGGIAMSFDGFMKYERKTPRRLPDKDQYGLSALHRLYETSEDWLYLIAESQQQWEALCIALGRDDLASDARFALKTMRQENDAALSEELSQILKSGSMEDLVARLKEAAVHCAPVVKGYNVGFFSDPQAIANDMIIEYQHPTLGMVKLMRNGVFFRDTSDVNASPAPMLGEHTSESLRELGYSDDQVAELYDKSIVKTEGPPQE